MMLAWLKSPRGSTVTATAAAAILALFWFAPWSRPLPTIPGLPLTFWSEPPAQVAAVPPTPAAISPTPTIQAPTAPAPTTTTTASTSPATVPATAPADPAPIPAASPAGSPPGAPSFDVVRVEPSGAAIVAGRGDPGSVVTLLDGGQPVAKATVDAAGQFVMLPPDLGEGSHYLTLQAGIDPQGPVSKQGVVVAVPKSGGTSRPMVAMLSPDQPVRVLSDGASMVLPIAPGAATPAQAVAIQAVEASRGGKFTASGIARAGSQSRVYLNGAFLADVTADKDGRWAVRVEKGMRPGQYVVRADELEGTTGKVVHRAEVPFTYPATLGKGSGKQLLMAHAQPSPHAIGAAAGSATSVTVASAAPGGSVGPTLAAAPSAKPGQTMAGLPSDGVAPGTSPANPVSAAVVADLKLTTVSRGDSLWRISRKLLGRGMDYTEIFASNTNQIRDPALIYPGQIFVLPQHPAAK